MDLRQLLSSTSVKPGNLLKLVISISVVLLVLWLFLVSRMQLTDQRSEDRAIDRIERNDSLRVAFRGESQTNVPSDRSEGEQRPGLFFNAFTTFIVLISILAVVWIWARKRGVGMGSSGPFTLLEEQAVGQGATLRILELNGEIWVLGITSSNVNLLHRCSKEEWRGDTADLKRNREKESSFSDYLKKQK